MESDPARVSTAAVHDDGARLPLLEHLRPGERTIIAINEAPELMEVFRGYYARRKSEFVIESDSTPLPFDAHYGVG